MRVMRGQRTSPPHLSRKNSTHTVHQTLSLQKRHTHKCVADSRQVKIIKVMRDDVVHGINVTLATNTISVKDIHGGAETRKQLLHGIVLGELPVSDRNIMSGRLSLIDWGHPPPYCSLESKGCVLLNVFQMVQQISI
ncbi:hypothetical protein HYC85_009748 [Camellia sinensis]|uniref:Uncharacterized protein n=1 Tax=Camellia sinensis TaxID=4442 RepID=A0A7J7HIJ3_CAMSI|nr:hypothetical protein HYC85_009748 [Camellia sinensis]